MRMITLVLLGVLICGPSVYGQASSADTKTLQAILEEVRQLRQDLHTTAATVQSAQVLLYRIRTQTDVVMRVSQHLEEARSLGRRIKFQKIQMAAGIERVKEEIEHTQDASARKELENEVSVRKQQLEQLSDEEQGNEAKEAEQASQLRLEQAKLDEMEAKLDQLEKRLEGAAGSYAPQR